MEQLPKEIEVQQWFYVKRPGENRVGPEHYEKRETTLSTSLVTNEVLIRIELWSVDPYMRIQQATRDTYDPPHLLNTVQQGGTVGRVMASNSSRFQVGDWVASYHGWQSHVKCHHTELRKLDPAVPPSTALGVLGMPGSTAWFGLMEAGKPRPGETLLVSGAAGAVGSLVVQFGKRAGCRVIGIAGGKEKCKKVVEVFGCDSAIDYKSFTTLESLREEIQKQTGGFDVYFDNVGGIVTDAALPLIKLRGRVVICGSIAEYEGGIDKPDLGPRFLHNFLFKRATIQGILSRDFTHRIEEMRGIVGPWVKKGEIVFEETVVEGFDSLPSALGMLFDGKNVGKLIVKA
jgi:NADPH-dependent curcumin reductase CurA